MIIKDLELRSGAVWKTGWKGKSKVLGSKL